MKFNKIISKSIITIALLGTTLGGAFSGINVNARTIDNKAAGVSGSQGSVGNTDTSHMAKSGINDSRTGDIGANVQDGTLTLDTVPNLGFGNNNDGNDDTSTLKLNTNNNGYIQVTDNRIADSSNDSSSHPGWSLTANLGNIQDNGSNINSSGWLMHLNPKGTQSITNTNGSSNSGTPNLAQNVNLNADSNNQSSPIINANGHNSGYGTNTVEYNNNSDAYLDIPNVQQGSYTTNINWQLNTNMGSYNTGYNG